jgi:hypothetical protein
MRRFSEFGEEANIILLGEPGSGKTHLFEAFAASEGGRYITTRNFLNSPSLERCSHTFIDALDEKRAGRGDQDTIDLFVRKLFELRPGKIRISCRERDWLGETDLAAFRPYFDATGYDYVVLMLQELDRSQQLEVLASRGISDPDKFLFEATERGVSAFLGNAQNVIMLSDLVQFGTWPDSRLALFEETASLLLSEHSRNRSRSRGGSHTAAELRESAGSILAASLISGVSAISLTEQLNNNDFPSFKDIPNGDPGKMLAALNRRLFIAGPIEDTVDYAHRTVAEYVAAGWLADHVRAGFPLERLRALLGVYGIPTSEMRGLHAWLAIFLPEYAQSLIDADSLGVLLDGDVGALPLASRRRLLRNIEGRQIGSSIAVRAPVDRRFGEGMEDELEEALRANAPPLIVQIVVDSLHGSSCSAHAVFELISIVGRQDLSPALRRRALDVVFEVKLEMASEPLIEFFRGHSHRTVDDINLMAGIYSHLSGTGLLRLEDALHLLAMSTKAMETGSEWNLHQVATCLPKRDLTETLNRFPKVSDVPDLGVPEPRQRAIANVFDAIFRRALTELPPGAENARLLDWLIVRSKFRFLRASVSRLMLAQLQVRQEQLCSSLLEAAAAYSGSKMSETFGVWIRKITFGVVSERDTMSWILCKLQDDNLERNTAANIYRLALSSVLSATEIDRGSFEELFEFAETRCELRDIRTSICEVSLQGSVSEPQGLPNDESPERARRPPSAVRIQFGGDVERVRSGKHNGWLGTIANIYFSRFLNLDRVHSPRKRLLQAFGEVQAEVALEALSACLARGDLPELSNVVASVESHRHPDWWMAILAAVNEEWSQSRNLRHFSRKALAIAFILERGYQTEKDELEFHRGGYGWIAAILSDRPESALDVYEQFVRLQLRRNERSSALDQVLSEELLSDHRAEFILRILEDASDAEPEPLVQLLNAGFSHVGNRRDFYQVVVQSASSLSRSGAGASAWKAAAFLLSSETVALPAGLSDSARSIVMDILRSSLALVRSNARQAIAILSFMGEKGVLSGEDRKMIEFLIARISLDPSHLAASYLQRSKNDQRFSSFRDALSDALSNQQTRERERRFEQPGWKQTLAALWKGVPANIGDLYHLVIVELEHLKKYFSATNVDVFKRFWNEDSHGRVVDPKSEESCRDVLAEQLSLRLSRLGISVEPEAHMARDRRADIAVKCGRWRLPLELKRDYHAELWSATADQLKQSYSSDLYAEGYGLLVVFWFGAKRPKSVPRAPRAKTSADTAVDLEQRLNRSVPSFDRQRLRVIVVDVSGGAVC